MTKMPKFNVFYRINHQDGGAFVSFVSVITMFAGGQVP